MRGLPHQPRGLALVLRRRRCLPCRAWRARIAPPDCRHRAPMLEQLGGALEVLRKLLALQIKQAEIVGGGRLPSLAACANSVAPAFAVARPAAALEIGTSRAQTSPRGSPRVGGALVPVAPPWRRRGRRRGHWRKARPSSVMRLRIVLGGELGGFLEGGQEIAALIGAERAVIGSLPAWARCG